VQQRKEEPSSFKCGEHGEEKGATIK